MKKEEIMNLRHKIDEKYKSSIKSRNINETNTLKLIKSAIKEKDIENRIGEKKGEIDDQKILNLLQNLIKQRKDSIESFKKASRIDLVKKEEEEIEYINHFLPKQLEKEEIIKIIKKFIDDENLTSMSDMGKIMNFLKINYAGTLDMSIAGKIAKDFLNN